MLKYRLVDGTGKSRGTCLAEDEAMALKIFESQRTKGMPECYQIVEIGPATAADVHKELKRVFAVKIKDAGKPPKTGKLVLEIRLHESDGDSMVAHVSPRFESPAQQALALIALQNLVHEMVTSFTMPRGF